MEISQNIHYQVLLKEGHINLQFSNEHLEVLHTKDRIWLADWTFQNKASRWKYCSPAPPRPSLSTCNGSAVLLLRQFSHQSPTFLPLFFFRLAFISFCWLEAAKAARWSSLGDLWPTLPPDIRLCNLGDGPWCFHRGFWHRYHAEGVIINILCNRLFYAVEADLPPIGFNGINDSWPNQCTDSPFW